jgi:hypothetical protein
MTLLERMKAEIDYNPCCLVNMLRSSRLGRLKIAMLVFLADCKRHCSDLSQVWSNLFLVPIEALFPR